MDLFLWKGLASVFCGGENDSADGNEGADDAASLLTDDPEGTQWTNVVATENEATIVHSVTPTTPDLATSKRIVTVARAHGLNCRLRVFDRGSFVEVAFETADQVCAFREALDADQIVVTFELHVDPVHA